MDMTFEEELTALLMPLVDDEVYWDTTPDNYVVKDTGVIILQTVGGERAFYADQARPELQHARVQVQAWGRRRMAVFALFNAVEITLSQSSWTVIPYGAPIGDANSDMELHGSRQDFGFWYATPA
jgi:hypothetical protein